LLTAYGAAKAAVIHYVKGLAVEWAGFARANSVSLGHIATDISNHAPKETKDVWKEKIPQQTRGHDEEQVAGPTRKKTLNITSNVITGAPLKLRFRDLDIGIYGLSWSIHRFWGCIQGLYLLR